MSHHLLNAFHVCAVLDHMYRERMPQSMRCYVVRDPRAGNIVLQDLPESLAAHFMSLAVCKKRGFRSVPDEIITSVLYIFRKQVSAGIPDGNDPFFLVSTADYISQLKIDVFQFHMENICQPLFST